ncbi:DinB family protein [Heyndrickxia sp. NPDC080065]|uniref:DinB family protein n=1 Tax=Heyndrickxia sp. NPDC080065 TaxID=3390568 RepID=UPI003D05240A
MYMFFEYNWQVRDEWFQWCENISEEELILPRDGGVGSILKTLFHIVDVEQAWINGLQGNPEYHYNFKDYPSLSSVKELSNNCRLKVKDFVQNWSKEIEKQKLDDFTYAEVIRHVIAHEIHHIGQLSVWSRELGLSPVSANLIGRGLTTNLS